MFLSLKLVFAEICITHPHRNSLCFIDLALNKGIYCALFIAQEIIEATVNRCRFFYRDKLQSIKFKVSR